MRKILVIDDEKEMLDSLVKILSFRKEFDVTAVNDPKEAISVLENRKFDLVLTDLEMGEISGIDICKAAFKKFPGTMGIIISGYGTIQASVNAIRIGAFDFIEKPFSAIKLFETIDRAFQRTAEMDAPTINEFSKKELKGIIFKSKKIQDILDLIGKISSGDMNVLITGESGTGKELFARAIHNFSKRKGNPFVPVNCGALPETLFESELFGYEKGAFTGAIKTKPGLIEFAENGTFFFDEIGEMSLALQVKLLRLLEEQKIRRIGAQKEKEINVRIIAATNQNLEDAVQQNRFREDLYYRLNSIKIEIPPLRERREDIIPLFYHYMNELCAREGSNNKRITPEAEEAMVNYDWPGNVREIQNLINKAYYLCTNDVIQISDLPLTVSKTTGKLNQSTLMKQFKDAKDVILEKFEIEYLNYHLKQHGGNISKTAEACGIDRRTIHRLVSKYNIFYKD
ncbi:MAG: sigma-54 dependent transcriptional regulator [Bacteroidota bacterium]